MKVLSPQRIKQLSADQGNCAMPVGISDIDFSKPFIHEHFTQLYYTSHYSQLAFQQKLRYNQLFGVRVSEQFMMFERDFTNRILAKLLRHPDVAAHTDLTDCLIQMVQEERRHLDMFRELNRRCLPEIYLHQDRYFTRLAWYERAASYLSTSCPRYLTFLLWFLIAMEELSIGISRSMLKERRTESLGELEPNVVRVHTEHVKDESRHVHIDVRLINACLSHLSGILRTVNAFLFKAFMKDILIPKRTGLAVIRHWLKDHPELLPMRESLIRSTLALRHHDAFRHSIFSRSLMPHTFALLDAQPEFHDLGQVMKSYDRKVPSPEP